MKGCFCRTVCRLTLFTLGISVNSGLLLFALDWFSSQPFTAPHGTMSEAFAASAKDMRNVHVEGTSDIQLLKVLGDWAWMRNRLKVAITTSSGARKLSANFCRVRQ